MKLERVPFRNWDLVVWVNEQDGDAWVAVKPIADAIGVEWSGQQKKLLRDPKFNCVPMYTVAEDGKGREMLCLPIKQINGWLYSINSNRVRADVRVLLLEFQAECHEALHRHLNGRSNSDVVEHLQSVICSLQGTLAEKDAYIERLEANIKLLAGSLAFFEDRDAFYTAEMDALKQRLMGVEGTVREALDVDASCAGKRLSAARHLRLSSKVAASCHHMVTTGTTVVI
jgi:hypothetical protein